MRAPSETASDGGRVLVVEDDVDTGRMLCELLRTAGYRVEWVKRGREAMERLVDERAASDVDVILLDLMLPDVDGSAVAAHVSTLSRRPPVIILSSRSAGALARQPGIVRAFRKPFEVQRLLTTMAYAVRPKSLGFDDPELVAACALLRARPPKLGASDESTWALARDVVRLALARLSEGTWDNAPYDVRLAVRAHRAAEHAERAVATVYIPLGGGSIDCALGDVQEYTVLQLALALARWLGDGATAAGEA